MAAETSCARGTTLARMPMLKTLFWGSAAALAWTHAGYPLADGALARVRERRIGKDPAAEPSVAVIVSAYNEETVIDRRLANLLALDYPGDRLEIVVASDASSDRTNELVEAGAAHEPRVRLLDCPRGGKVAAQDRAVRETTSDVVAFSDANATWAPDALRHLVANLADPDVAYVCGRLRLLEPSGRRPRGPVRLRPAAARGRGGLEPRGPLLALRALAPRAGVTPRLGHGRERLDRRAAPRRLRRGRPALGARPPLPLPDGAGGPPRGLRARRARVRAADADERGRVRPQGADVRALLGDHAARRDAAAAAARLPRLGDLASRAPLRQRGAPPRAPRNEPRARADRLAVRARPPRPARRARRLRRRHPDRAVLRLRHVGDRPGALELPPPRGSGHLGGRRGDPLNRALDVTLAGLGLVVASPLLAVAALAAQLQDGRAVPLRTRAGWE